ncbi:PREDICTED: MICOS complex subunit mic60-like [Nicotiana attenuata]|uniref:MICOS complex subunit mic60-like n=1 Tax=Nicotiana attenuata TaxID=49451 RepID=UPI0009055ABE|nr:PREDICTED: MICOS complex subunit mic60-like [Nicotiana attenuata]
MSNPQDNPGTPPQPTASDSSIPPPPSTTPQPRRRRVKMLARKTVATGALLKKLNEKLKPSQAQDSENSNDSFKFSNNRFVLVGSVRNVELPESRRRGVPAICGVEHATVEESRKKTGGSGSGEAAEGLVNLSSQVDEPGSSVEETLTDLLKKVGASYDPKKRRTPTPKAPNTAKPSKKRKAPSPTTAEIPLPKGRATRSMKKRMDKGKTKVAEPSEAVDVEEIEQVHEEEHTTVEVQTSKPKKTRTSSKKFSSGSKVAEPSLAKRTRSAVKNKPVKIAEDEEWSGEEESESDSEQDKLAKFEVKDGRVTSQVKGVPVTFDAEKLGEILDIPVEGYDDYTRQR